MPISLRVLLALIAAALAFAVIFGWQNPDDADRVLAVAVIVLAAGEMV